MQTVKSLSIYSPSPLFNLFIKIKHPFSYVVFSSLSVTSKASNSPLFELLFSTFKFSKNKALKISNGFAHTKSIENPQYVLYFLQTLGFSKSNVQSAILGAPQILFANIDKSIKPKIKLFQNLGLEGDDLGKFFAKNSTLLTASLEKKLVPRIEILKKLLLNDEKNEDLVKVIIRCNWIISKYPDTRLSSNVALLESSGIVGSQLSMLLRRQPRLFIMQESALRDLVSRVLTLGFSANSRMLVHALYTVSCISDETLGKKFEILKSFGFSEYECKGMFKKQPGLLRSSEKKLKLGLDFFLNTVKFKKEVLVYRPTCLMHSMEERVIPRYNVLEIIKSKKVLKKQPSFINVLSLSEEEFVLKFVTRFPEYAEELLVTYKG